VLAPPSTIYITLLHLVLGQVGVSATLLAHADIGLTVQVLIHAQTQPESTPKGGTGAPLMYPGSISGVPAAEY